MKKRKLFLSLGSVAALTLPMAGILATTTSCSGMQYAELISEMKDDCIQRFIYICKNTHRNLWNEGEGFTYVKKQMQSMGFEPSGGDWWSQLNAVKRMRQTEMSPLETWGGDYGNIWFDIPASSGYENVPKVILQCHLDSQMSFGSDEIHTQWAKEIGESGGGGFTPNFNNSDEIMSCDPKFKTSLGADGGVGMAILLTIAKYRNEFKHPGIRLMFTAGESEACPEVSDDAHETAFPEYASGFSLLYYDQLRQLPTGETKADFYYGTKPFGENGEYKYISSVSGVMKNKIFVSSSGIHECAITSSSELEDPTGKKWNALNDLLADREQGPEQNKKGNKISWDEQVQPEWSKETLPKKWMKLSVSGLQGGTSSTYIGKKQASAINLLFRLLFTGDTDMQLIQCSSSLPSAYSIAQSAEAQVVTCYDKATFELKKKSLLPSLKILYPNEDWANVKINFECLDDDPLLTRPNYAMSKTQTRDFIRMIASELYYGPINWFENGDVKTSENIGPCILNITEPDGETPAHFELNFHVVERSSEKAQLQIFKALTHSIIDDGLTSWFNPDNLEDRGYWQNIHVAHMANPVWEAPTKSDSNLLANAYKQAYNSFKIRNSFSNEHAWLEIACAGDIYERIAEKDPTWTFTTPYCVMIGPQVEMNHSIDEVLYTDTLASVLETTVYVLDNSRGLLPK